MYINIHYAGIHPQKSDLYFRGHAERPQPQKFSKLVSLTYFGQSCISLSWLSGAPVGVGGSDVIS